MDGLNNFLTTQNPERYGGYQQDYLKQSQEVIQEALNLLKNEVKNNKDLTQTFVKIREIFSARRYMIAKAHQTKNYPYFGRKRIEITEMVSHTLLTGEYKSFNDKIICVFQQHLKNHIPKELGKLKPKKIEIEESYLGRKCWFEIQFFTPDEIKQNLWDQFPAPSGIVMQLQDAQKEISFPRIENSYLNQYPPTHNEKKTLKKHHEAWKAIKEKFPSIYTYEKMACVFELMEKAFPTPEMIPSATGNSFMVKGNANYIKTLYLIGKVRIEIEGKRYALSEYITWVSQDGLRDPVEGLKNASIIILHQDKYLINRTLQEAAQAFEKAVRWNQTKPTQELINEMALVRYLTAHSMEDARGSAANSEWMEQVIYRYHKIECLHSKETMGDLEALVAPMWSTFGQECYVKSVLLTLPKIVKKQWNIWTLFSQCGSLWSRKLL